MKTFDCITEQNNPFMVPVSYITSTRSAIFFLKKSIAIYKFKRIPKCTCKCVFWIYLTFPENYGTSPIHLCTVHNLIRFNGSLRNPKKDITFVLKFKVNEVSFSQSACESEPDIFSSSPQMNVKCNLKCWQPTTSSWCERP